ncbi:hypothetical protein M3Y94_00299000 [Aphelenchoides besseyi]|nr:hypothetical protein M3Y94_00299000 [Aphelenchoides besseyi]
MDDDNDVFMKDEVDEAREMQLAKRDLDAEDEKQGFRTYIVSVNPIAWDQFNPIQTKPAAESKKDAKKLFRFSGPYEHAVRDVEDGKSVVISSPPSTGKTLFAMWAATNACKRQKNFAYVVPSVEKCHEVYVELNNEDYMEHGKPWIIPNLGKNSGSDDDVRQRGRTVITIKKLHELLMNKNLLKYDENKYTVFIFDDLDSMQHSGLGHLYEEAIANIECGSQIIATLSEFSNVELVARWIATAQEGYCCVVESIFRPYILDLNIAVQATKLDKVGLHRVMQLKEIKSASNPLDVKELQKANKQISYLQTEKKSQTLRQITESVRLAVRELFATRDPRSLLIVTFSRRDCQLIARDLGQHYTAITEGEKERIWLLVNKIYSRIKSRYPNTPEQMDLVREDSDYLLFEQNKNQFIHGVICIYPGMPKILRDFYDDLYRRRVVRVIVVTDEIAINSPYRGQSILLSSIRKYDGKNYRYLTNYEFRRCLCFALEDLNPRDKYRSITLLLDWTISVEAFKEIVIPKPSELTSAYAPTLMTVKECKTNNMLTSLLKKTFYNIHRLDKIETIQRDKPLLEHEIEGAANEPDNEIVDRYLSLKRELKEKEKKLDDARYEYSLIENHIKNVGRLVKIVNDGRDFGWGCNYSLRRTK